MPLRASLAANAILALALVGLFWFDHHHPAPPPAPEPDISLPRLVKAAVNDYAVIEATTAGKTVRWHFPPEVKPHIDGHVARVVAPAGRYTVWAWTALHGQPSDLAECTVEIGGVPPVPPVPPPPPPSPAPIPAAGLHVLVVYDSVSLSKLTPAQTGILYSRKVRDYLDAKCPIGPDGKTKEWRIWDKDVDASGESALWQAALKRPRATVPWVIVSNPNQGGGYEGPLPASVDEALTLLKKYGG